MKEGKKERLKIRLAVATCARRANEEHVADGGRRLAHHQVAALGILDLADFHQHLQAPY